MCLDCIFEVNQLRNLFLQLAWSYTALNNQLVKTKDQLNNRMKNINDPNIQNLTDLELKMFYQSQELDLANSTIKKLKTEFQLILREREEQTQNYHNQLLKAQFDFQKINTFDIEGINELSDKLKDKQNFINELKNIIKQQGNNVSKLKKKQNQQSSINKIIEIENQQLQQQVAFLQQRINNLQPLQQIVLEQNGNTIINTDQQIIQLQNESIEVSREGENISIEALRFVKQSINTQNQPSMVVSDKLEKLKKLKKDLEQFKPILIEFSQKIDLVIEKLLNYKQEIQNKNRNQRIDQSIIKILISNKSLMKKILQIWESYEQLIIEILSSEEINTLANRVNQQQAQQRQQILTRRLTFQQVQNQNCLQKDIKLNKKQKMQQVYDEYLQNIQTIYKQNIFNLLTEIEGGIQSVLQLINKDEIKGNVSTHNQTFLQFLASQKEQPTYKIFSGCQTHLEQIKNSVKNQNVLPGVLIVCVCRNQQAVLENFKSLFSQIKRFTDKFQQSIKVLIS